MTDFFREVDEELRREQLGKAWSRFGPFVIAVAVLIVAATAGYRFWEWYQSRIAGAAGEAYYDAVATPDATAQDIVAGLTPIAEGGSGYADLARLRIAAAQADAGEREAAVAGFDTIAGDASVDPLMRAVARIRAAYLLIDTASLQDMTERVGTMTRDDAPLRHSAREILGLTAYRTGDYTAAAEQFDAIMADQATPEDLRNRTELMQSLLTSRLSGDTAGEGSGQ